MSRRLTRRRGDRGSDLLSSRANGARSAAAPRAARLRAVHASACEIGLASRGGGRRFSGLIFVLDLC
jgi:hypothetical protein